MADDLSSVANLLYEMGTLKQGRRSGWWMAGVRDPESIAEHSWRTSLIASIIAKLEGADPARAATPGGVARLAGDAHWRCHVPRQAVCAAC